MFNNQEWIEFVLDGEEPDVPFTFSPINEEDVPEFSDYILQQTLSDLEGEFERHCYEEYLRQQEVDEAQDSRDAAA